MRIAGTMSPWCRYPSRVAFFNMLASAEYAHDDLRHVYLGFGNDHRRDGDPSWHLPVPSRFVVDRAGTASAVQADRDYTYRPELETTLSALRALPVSDRRST